MNAKRVEKIAKALADPNRLMILREIHNQDDCLWCADLTEMMPITQPSVCHHLKQLTDTDLIISEKEGRNLKYRLNNEVLDEFIDYLEALKTD